jgi:glucoamylase
MLAPKVVESPFSTQVKSRVIFGISKMKKYPKTYLPVFVCILLFLFCLSANAQTLAPGAPGKDAQWQSAGKQGVGTSNTLESKVWFTLAEGVMTEVYYPDVTIANVQELQFIVVNLKTEKVETERDEANHQVKVLRNDSLTFQQINTAKSGEWKITKTYTTDPERDTVLIDVFFEPKNNRLNDYQLYVYYDPSLGNSGMHDTGWIRKKAFLSNGKYEADAFLSQDGDKASALIFSRNRFFFSSNGFLGTSDGLSEIKNEEDFFKRRQYEKTENGNVVQVGGFSKLTVDIPNERYVFALGFGKNSEDALQTAIKSLDKGFAKCQAEYEKGWSDYVKTLRKVEPKYQAQFNMAAMILKAHEDKIHRGANIASLTVPWGGGSNANENNVGGYHLVWSRDLYQVATAYMALGDKEAAERALDFLFKVQQKADGSFPQNSWLDGKPFWDSLQLDEVAFPLILAYQLGKTDKATYENHVKKAADFIVKNGPKTPQERWEEEAGYSPSTIAAEIAGLVCAADIAKKNGDEASAKIYLATADDWQANIEKWTVTTTSKYGDGNYYLRITQNGKPDAGEKIELNNGAGFFDEREIVDAGFLELVRLGIKSADDPLIQKSIKVVDQVIKVNTPNGEAFYRYNNDGYGEMDDGRPWNFDGKYTGKGRLWALLAGERGQYELALAVEGEKGRKREGEKKNNGQRTTNNGREFLVKAKTRLDAMLGFANEGLMIPEQVWDKKEAPKTDSQFSPNLKFGEGTGSATPLAWSMAQFIRLAVNLKESKNLDTPQVVYDRYVLGKKENEILFQSGRQDFKTFAANWDCYNNWAISQSGRTPNSSPKFWAYYKDRTCVFIRYYGEGKKIEIAGDFTGWQPKSFGDDGRIIPLEFPNTARVEYKLIVDGKWITDPLNPNKIDNGVGGENSFFTMPDYKPTIWGKDTNEKPTIKTLEVDSKVFNEKRSIRIYIPHDALKTKKLFPVLYVQDGSDYIRRAKAIQIQQNLVKAGKIKPFIMVFIDYKDRMKEYWASDDYAKFLATEVVPAIDAKYKTIKSREGRAVMGASLGGVTSVWVGLKYPEIFSRIGGQSSAWQIDNERVVKELEKFNGKFTFYFDAGTFEGAKDDRKVVEILRKKGYDVTYQEGETGHNWTSWHDRLADAFQAIWK